MSPAAGDTSLEVEEAQVFYGAQCAFDRVSLRAEPGQFVALLGASGCGKTTLLRAICGFVALAGGRISIGGRDVGNLPPDRRNVAMVFQSYALWPHMTVARNIGYGLKLRRTGRAEIAERVATLCGFVRPRFKRRSGGSGWPSSRGSAGFGLAWLTAGARSCG